MTFSLAHDYKIMSANANEGWLTVVISVIQKIQHNWQM